MLFYDFFSEEIEAIFQNLDFSNFKFIALQLILKNHGLKLIKNNLESLFSNIDAKIKRDLYKIILEILKYFAKFSNIQILYIRIIDIILFQYKNWT